MLYDAGLATEEDKRILNGPRVHSGGCIDRRVCEKCSHIIVDSICLCIPCFTCPNCGFENGAWVKEMNKQIREAQVFPIRFDGLFVLKQEPEYSI